MGTARLCITACVPISVMDSMSDDCSERAIGKSLSADTLSCAATVSRHEGDVGCGRPRDMFWVASIRSFFASSILTTGSKVGVSARVLDSARRLDPPGAGADRLMSLSCVRERFNAAGLASSGESSSATRVPPGAPPHVSSSQSSRSMSTSDMLQNIPFCRLEGEWG